MTIYQQGSINTTGQVVPDLLIQIVPPALNLNGVPTNVLGIVGTATWGPVGSPTTASGQNDATQKFGKMQNRKYDLGTAVYTASLQGASNFRLVRATDGTDTAASATLNQTAAGSVSIVNGGTGHANGNVITLTGGATVTVTSVTSGAITAVTLTNPGTYPTIPSNPVAQTATTGTGTGATFNLTFPTGLTLNAKYTGSTGNTLVATLSAGTAANSTRLTVSMPGTQAEVYDNIAGSGNALFAALAAAINQGTGFLRGLSQLVTATAGAATGAPAYGSLTFSGGTDGATNITSATLIGQDVNPRKGMYALRGTGCSVALLADADDSGQWTLQNAYGLSEGTYMIATSPAGDTISNFASSVATAGVDSYGIKLLLGDYCLITDTVNNGIQRLVSPQGFNAGKLANLSPEQSALNKPLSGIIATQKTLQNQQYSNADLQQLALARGDVITNPIPAGQVFGSRLGLNSSSNAGIADDNYPRLTNYIAATLNRGMGLYIGMVQSATVQGQARATLDNFLRNMFQQNMIQAWKVILDATNNPQTRTGIGYMQADVMVQYLSIIRYFLINMQNGQTVVISNNTPTAAFT